MWAQAIRRARDVLADAGVASPEADARSLAEFVCGRVPFPHDDVAPADRERYEALVNGRARRCRCSTWRGGCTSAIWSWSLFPVFSSFALRPSRWSRRR
ncbi:hypothetical protein [Trueperella pyogenes]|uniref:hypothetical protein n=1 Tax=Trueperella pyogenes TaxID=1661 RepID=UPI003DA976A6